MTDYTVFQRNLPDILMIFQEPMANHTSFRIGGNAAVMVFPKNTQELADVLHQCRDCGFRYRILGAGTNVLAPDAGIDGVVICLKDKFDGIERIGDTAINVNAGVTMTRAAVFAANLGLSGMEFAHGIPGTVGGGVYMNAGAYGGEMKDICISVDVMDQDGNVQTISNEQMEFSYRHSILEENDFIVLSAVFQLTESDPETVKAKMKELMGKRSASQPLDLPSAGSAFKRPVGGYAAALIDQAGLKGYRVGGAAISAKHAGFAVNLGGASAEDVKQLLSDVSDKVFINSGIRLEPEVRIW